MTESAYSEALELAKEYGRPTASTGRGTLLTVDRVDMEIMSKAILSALAELSERGRCFTEYWPKVVRECKFWGQKSEEQKHMLTFLSGMATGVRAASAELKETRERLERAEDVLKDIKGGHDLRCSYTDMGCDKCKAYSYFASGRGDKAK